MPETMPYLGEDPEAARKRISSAGAQAQALETLPAEPAPMATPTPAPTPMPRPAEMQQLLDDLAKRGIYDPKGDVIAPTLGSTAALNAARQKMGGNVPPWFEQLMEAAKSGTPFTTMKFGTEVVRERPGKVSKRTVVKE